MSEARSTQSFPTTCPRMSSPRISLARASRLVGVGGELDPTRLAPASGQHLGLDDHLAAELLGCRAGLLRRLGEPALGDRDPGGREELLALVLVEIHGGRTLTHAVRRNGVTG